MKARPFSEVRKSRFAKHRRRTHLRLETLESRNLLATVFVNDDWTIQNDTGGSGLTTGDSVINNLDGGNTTADYGTTAFGFVVTEMDDFSDGNDSANPTWTRFDPFAVLPPPLPSRPATFSFPNGQYRIRGAASPQLDPLGPSRAGSFLSDTHNDFVVSADITDFSSLPDQSFGLLARTTDIGLGTSDGYILAYDSAGEDLNIVEIVGEDPDTIELVDIGALNPDRDYRLVFRGVGTRLTGEIYELPNLDTPLATVTATDTTYSQGVAGVFNSVFPVGAGTTDTTFDNMSVAKSLPNNGSISNAVSATNPGDTLTILDGDYFENAITSGAINVEIGQGVGHVSVQGLTLNSAATYSVDLQGTDPADYDQLNASSNVSLAGANLQVRRGVAALPGTTFEIIQVGSGAQVFGQFNGLPEGATLEVDGQPFTISYRGGVGNNDVVLTAQAAVMDVPALKDNSIFDEGDLSNGSGEHLFTGRTNRTDLRRALIAFDFTNIPANSTVVDSQVTLQVNLVPTSGAVTSSVFLHKALSDWGESTSDASGPEGRGAAAEAGDATWRHSSFDTQLWNTLGGDFQLGPSASTTVSGTGPYSWSGAGITNDVQSWLDGEPNTGWFAIGNEIANKSAKRYGSRENGNPSQRPVLSVSFVPPVLTPTVDEVFINAEQIDPPDLPAGPAPTGWAMQRSDIRSISIEFSESMAPISPSDLVLTNLGINAPVDPDTVVAIAPGQLNQTGDALVISFDREVLPEGAYSLEILPTATNVDGLPLDSTLR